MKIRDQLYAVALERGLRQSTVLSYERLLSGLGVIDQDVATVTQEAVLEALWRLDNPNTRRATIIAIRSVSRPQNQDPPRDPEEVRACPTRTLCGWRS